VAAVPSGPNWTPPLTILIEKTLGKWILVCVSSVCLVLCRDRHCDGSTFHPKGPYFILKRLIFSEIVNWNRLEGLIPKAEAENDEKQDIQM
jgi:hypothetical protein